MEAVPKLGHVTDKIVSAHGGKTADLEELDGGPIYLILLLGGHRASWPSASRGYKALRIETVMAGRQFIINIRTLLSVDDDDDDERRSPQPPALSRTPRHAQ